MNINNFILLYPIGKGSFGKVYKVKCKINNKYYAMKIMSKPKIISKAFDFYIRSECLILSKLRSDFIVNMICSFQDFNNLYLTLQLMEGGDLKYHLSHYNISFTENQIKFIIANISLALKKIHKMKIIHRDIKPENFLLDANGYLHLTDFGIAKYENEENKTNKEKIVGTLGYIPPEILLNLDNKKSIFSNDFYSFGVICYELIYRKKPYNGQSTTEIIDEINNNQIYFDNDNNDYSKYLINFVKNLLVINPEKRLGFFYGFNEIVNNDLFSDYNWEDINDQSIKSPLIEVINYCKNNSNSNYPELFDYEYCNESDKISENTKLKYAKIQANQNYILLFQNYTQISLDVISPNKVKRKETLFDNLMKPGATKIKLKPIHNKKLCYYNKNEPLTTGVIYPSYNNNDLLKFPEINKSDSDQIKILKYKNKKYKNLLDKLNSKTPLNNKKIYDYDNLEKNEKSIDNIKRFQFNNYYSLSKNEYLNRIGYDNYYGESEYYIPKRYILNNFYLPRINYNYNNNNDQHYLHRKESKSYSSICNKSQNLKHSESLIKFPSNNYSSRSKNTKRKIKLKKIKITKSKEMTNTNKEKSRNSKKKISEKNTNKSKSKKTSSQLSNNKKEKQNTSKETNKSKNKTENNKKKNNKDCKNKKKKENTIKEEKEENVTNDENENNDDEDKKKNSNQESDDNEQNNENDDENEEDTNKNSNNDDNDNNDDNSDKNSENEDNNNESQEKNDSNNSDDEKENNSENDDNQSNSNDEDKPDSEEENNESKSNSEEKNKNNDDESDSEEKSKKSKNGDSEIEKIYRRNFL